MKRGLSLIVKGWRCLPGWDRWFAIPFMFVLFALLGWVPDIYLRKTEIPPFEQLERTSGIISFERLGRSGWRTELSTNQAKLKFSCLSVGRDVDCMHAPDGHSKLQHRPATIWWFTRPHPYTEDRYAVQIEIDGVIMQSYEQSVKGLASSKKLSNWSTLFWVSCPFVYLISRIRSCLKKDVTPHG